MANICTQSSVIPFRLIDNKFQILLITSLNSGDWIFPKGIIEKGMSAREAAAQEALEEAGVTGSIPDLVLGTYQYKKWGGICRVQVFPMQVQKILEEWPESHERTRVWVSLKKARKMIQKKHLMSLLDTLEKSQVFIQKSIE